ncbi:MAG: hypothetical protein NWQ32_10270 [Paracoccaceae bacterium]|nr:hypothetical protein [Paracoccaceae bacterium]
MSLATFDTMTKPSPADLRATMEGGSLRPRDMAHSLGVTEADLLVARVGRGVPRRASRLSRPRGR